MVTAVMRRIAFGAMIVSCLGPAVTEAQESPRVFIGVVSGVSTLSADGRSEITAGGADVSLYKPENGPSLNALAGVHLREYVTIQANFIWNRNTAVLTSVSATDRGLSFHEQPVTSSQRALVGDLLVYFRERRRVVRPYLSFGAGVVRFESAPDGPSRSLNTAPPGASFRATHATLRVAVGLDLALGHGWSARYSFSESVSANPISAQLSPPAQRNLANFQNLVGVVRAF